MKTRLLAGPRRWRLAGLLGVGLLQALAALGAAICVKVLFDEVLFAPPRWRVDWIPWAWAGGFAGASLALAALKVLERVEAERLGFDYTADVRVELFDRIGELSPRALSSQNEGTVLVRFVGDLTALKQWVSQGLVRLLVAAVLTATLLAALAVFNWPLALALAGVLTLGFAVGWRLSHPLRRAVREARRSRALLSGFVAERVQAMATLRSLGGLERERRRVLRRSDEARGASVRRASAAGAMVGLVQATLAAATLATLLVGAHQVASGSMTTGAVVAAMTLVGSLVSGLGSLGRIVELWHAAQASRDKIKQLLAIEEPSAARGVEGPVAAHARARTRRNEAFVFENVGLPGVLTGVSLTAEPGKVVAITGASGVGKSTLLQLGARLIEPAEGRILLGGQDIAGMPLEAFRRAIGLVSAEAPLLRGSLRMNLVYRRPDATQEEIDAVVSLCGLDALLKDAPEGDRLRISERGRNLSLGERQRLMLARALIGRPSVLLLDEADSNLDERTADRVGQFLKTYPGVVLMVSRRQSWLELASQTWRVRRNGSVQVRAAGAPSHPPSTRPARRRRRRADPAAAKVERVA